MTRTRPKFDPFALHDANSDDERMIRRLVIAAADMRMAQHAAEAQLDGDAPGLGRLLETAMIVCYARPFTRQGIGRLDEEWVPQGSSERELHDEDIARRGTQSERR